MIKRASQRPLCTSGNWIKSSMTGPNTKSVHVVPLPGISEESATNISFAATEPDTSFFWLPAAAIRISRTPLRTNLAPATGFTKLGPPP